MTFRPRTVLLFTLTLAVLAAAAVFGLPPHGGPGKSATLAAGAPRSPAQGTPTATPPTTCPRSWSVVSSPNGGFQSDLYGVAVVGPNDVWAVGQRNISPSGTLTEHWDGTAWSVVPSPDAQQYTSNTLYAVAVVGSNDIWGVGDYYNPNDAEKTLIEHWDGSAWTIIPSPNMGSSDNFLTSVAALSANDVWAVGYYDNGGGGAPLALHWNGSVWSVALAPPTLGYATILKGVAGSDGTHVWTVGSYYDNTGNVVTLTAQWEGSQWTVVPSPNPGLGSDELRGVAARAPNDVWAVGVQGSSGTLAMHWDGTAWSVVNTPDPTSINALNAVTIAAPADVWAVGTTTDPQAGGFDTLIEHWDGTAWVVAASADPVPAFSYLYGVAAVSAADVWTVGNDADLTLIEHYGGACATATATSTPTATATSTCEPIWRIEPNGTGRDGDLVSLAVLSADDIWAVGDVYTANMQTALIEHWDGSMWTGVAGPDLGPAGGTLSSIAAVSPTNLWAVGTYAPHGTPSQSLVLHWDGTAWSIVPSPSPGGHVNYLTGVSATGPTDAWAVGAYFDDSLPGGYHTLTLHWNGTTWTEIPSPNPGTWNNILYGVNARAANDAWAVGTAESPGIGLSFHWDGSTWTQMPSPNPGYNGNTLNAVLARTTADAWSVGFSMDSGDYHTLTEHWDGSTWTQIPSPDGEITYNYLNAIAAAPGGALWAVGRTGSYYGPDDTLILRWDGSAWIRMPSPNVDQQFHNLVGIAAVSTGDLWAVGNYTPERLTPGQTLVERFSSACTTLTPTGTRPPATFTRTPTPTAPPVRTGTVTATAPAAPSTTSTPCAMTFSDVHSTDYFYDPVRYMACRGVVSGYADGAFRPYNNTTRAQMVKIVVLGFNVPAPGATPTGGYTFADVPPPNPFFGVIEAASARGIVSGYVCGGPGETCDDQHRPYFRPNASVTRGQLSKIDAIAAAWPLQNPTNPTFTDVAPGSAFYPFVETAVCHGVISGYGDHTFRPGANATRGQISKIVYLSITSSGGCSP
jgi:hypothetical protein